MLFTMGYQLRDQAELVEELIGAGVDVVIDVRENPWSYVPGYRRSALEEALKASGIEYIHAGFAGNPKRLRDAADSHEECLAMYRRYLDENPGVVDDFRNLLTRLGEDGRVGCLLCYERHPDDCHRSLLLDAAGALNVTQHLGPEGAPRFLKA